MAFQRLQPATCEKATCSIQDFPSLVETGFALYNNLYSQRVEVISPISLLLKSGMYLYISDILLVSPIGLVVCNVSGCGSDTLHIVCFAQ
jgi:hypothetical protein